MQERSRHYASTNALLISDTVPRSPALLNNLNRSFYTHLPITLVKVKIILLPPILRLWRWYGPWIRITYRELVSISQQGAGESEVSRKCFFQNMLRRKLLAGCITRKGSGVQPPAYSIPSQQKTQITKAKAFLDFAYWNCQDLFLCNTSQVPRWIWKHSNARNTHTMSEVRVETNLTG